jgi:hypothetical protein
MSQATPASEAADACAWEQLLKLRNPLLRDAGAALACPPLLAASRELPVAASLPLQASGSWAEQLTWLRALDASPPPPGSRTEAALQRLAAFKTHRRLGVYFQECVAFWLREYPPFAAATAELELNAQVRAAQACGDDAAADAVADDGDGAQRAAAPAVPPDAAAVASARLQRREAAQRRRATPRAPRAAPATANTTGEFDVLLLGASPVDADATSPARQRRVIHHLELSVKFLLFASEAELALMTAPPTPRVWWPGGPLGEFVGPHAFESFSGRIARMQRQLALPASPPGRAFLRRRFGSDDDDGDDDFTVQSQAFIKGFLFQPHAAWAQAAPPPPGGGNDGAELHCEPCWHHAVPLPAVPPCSDGSGAPPEAARVFGGHWCGWWSRDAAAVAAHPRHAASRWLVLPKRDWLSPALMHDCPHDGDVAPATHASIGIANDGGGGNGRDAGYALLDAAGLAAAVAAADEALCAEVAAEAAAEASGQPRTRRQRSWAESRRRQRRMLVAEMRRVQGDA